MKWERMIHVLRIHPVPAEAVWLSPFANAINAILQYMPTSLMLKIM